MNGATERRIVYLLCLVGLIISLITLIIGLDQSNVQVIGVSLLLVALTIGTGVAAWRSGNAREEGAGDEVALVDA